MTIGDRHYWDGSIVSNWPLDQVTERCGAAGKRFIVVDLFPHAKRLPSNMIEVMGAPDGPAITRIVRESGHGEPVGRDFDFSLHSIRALVEDGLQIGRRALIGPRKEEPTSTVGAALASPPVAPQPAEHG